MGASTLWERLDPRLFWLDPAMLDAERLQRRWEHWQNLVAPADSARLERRLHWDGLDIERVRLALGVTPLFVGNTFPGWIATLRVIVAMTRELHAGEHSFAVPSQLALDPQAPLPFEAALLPMVLAARQQLFARWAAGSQTLFGHLSQQAYRDLERGLLRRLADLCDEALFASFEATLPFGLKMLHRLVPSQASAPPASTYYDAFVQGLNAGELLAFFRQYPVLARLVASCVDFWVDAVSELVDRLAADQQAIRQTFLPRATEQPGQVVAITTTLSDPHHAGRVVLALSFEAGLKLIYKPRSLGLDQAFDRLLDWCDQQGAPLPLHAPRVLDCGNYGWMAFVEHQSCPDEKAAQRLFERSGGLLCLLYLLNGADCHNENLIASGDELVLVDAEALLHPEARSFDRRVEMSLAPEAANHGSVLRSGLLPDWIFFADMRAAEDISGLGDVNIRNLLRQQPVWKSINTDAMRRERAVHVAPLSQHLAILNDRVLAAYDYRDQVVAGFQQMYRFLLAQRPALQSVESPLRLFNYQQTRFVARATYSYGVILRRSLQLAALRDGVERSIELDLLAHALLVDEQPAAWPVVAAETRALEQLDIPYFAVETQRTTLFAAGQAVVAEYLRQPGYAMLLSKLNALSEHDLVYQTRLILGAFLARVAQVEPPAQVPQPVAAQLQRPLSQERLLGAAVAIGQQLQNSALQRADGDLTWICLHYLETARCYRVQPLDSGLYDGLAGVGIFLAALSTVTDDAKYRLLATATLQSLLTNVGQLVASGHSWSQSVGIGAANGLGSLLYALTTLAGLLGEPEALSAAQAVAKLIDVAAIRADQQFDVMGGAAGVLLGLLRLYAAVADEQLLALARHCGDHLASRQVVGGSEQGGWKTIADTALTGFSHGAAGIAYALSRLYAVTGERIYLDAALAGIAYERRLFVPAKRNWPDLRDPLASEQRSFAESWCHGAPGIALARLGCLAAVEKLRDALADDEINLALDTTMRSQLKHLDHICCGNLGLVEVLLVATEQLNRPALVIAAHQRAAFVLDRAQQVGAYSLLGNMPHQGFCPGLFRGLAGVGYSLLRLAAPTRFPSVLLWQ